MELTSKQKKNLQSLADRVADLRVFWHDSGNRPAFLMGALTQPSGKTPEAIARSFLTSVDGLINRQGKISERLALTQTEILADGSAHLAFEQLINDVPVFEGSIQVHLDADGRVMAYKDHRATHVDGPAEPEVAEAEAMATVAADLDLLGLRAATQDAQLIFYRSGGDLARLAWAVTVTVANEIGPRHYFIDAAAGAILYKYAQIRGALSRATYSAGEREEIPGTLVIRDAEAAPEADAIARCAHDNAKVVYDYYWERFGRDSYDGRGATIRSTVHFGKKYNNAFWSDYYEQMVYGDGDGVRWKPLAMALDIVAHEMTHAVTARTARFVYAEQAGALDESFADIFGVMVSNDGDIVNWEMGEGVYTPFQAGDALRDLANPPRFDQPDHMDDYWPLAAGELPDPDKNDNGWVHVNSGIPNKAFYLMVAGGTHHGIRVEGLGRSPVEEILYVGLTAFLSSASRSRWTFEQARYACLNACRQAFGDAGPEYRTVKNAWAAVGVGEAAIAGEWIVAEQASDMAIADNDPAGVRAVLPISADGHLADIRVSVRIDHSYISDLRVGLLAPSGLSIMLHDRQGRAAHNIAAEYTPADTPAMQALMGAPITGDWTLHVADVAPVDTGRLVRWSLRLLPDSNQGAVVEKARRPEMPIPDNAPDGVSDRIHLDAAGRIVHLVVSVDISHTYIGDLRVVLAAPGGHTAVLHNRSGYSRHDLQSTYETGAVPVLDSLVGRSMKGDWTLTVVDEAARDVGQFNQWSLRIRYQSEG